MKINDWSLENKGTYIVLICNTFTVLLLNPQPSKRTLIHRIGGIPYDGTGIKLDNNMIALKNE